MPQLKLLHKLPHATSSYKNDQAKTMAPGPDPVFTRRGTIVVKSVQSKKATFSQVATLSSEDRRLLKVWF